ncbi:MAG: FAD:protein FMN transferase [Desulfobacterales bacterium]|nr:FAD:protein FMN transferase [Desulfobacterales bacterium]
MNKESHSPEADHLPRTQSRITRRKIIQITAVAGFLGAAWYFGIKPRSSHKTVRYSQPLMGTMVNMTVCGPREEECRTAIQDCIARMKQLSFIMSTYEPESPISVLNRMGVVHKAPPELTEVFRMARELSELTDGAFDPTVKPLLGLYKEVKRSGKLPSEDKIKEILHLVDYRHIVVEDLAISFSRQGVEVTLDGIAKGYIVDQGVAVLRNLGFTNAYVEAGGDLMTLGNRGDGNNWRIGIRNPRSDDLKKMDTIELSNRAIATSGDYLQYFTDDKRIHHIINPRTGFSPIETASSTILAPTVAKADGLATATMVLGLMKALELVESLPECEGYFIDKHLNKYQTTGFFS